MESSWQGQTSTVEAMFYIKGHSRSITCICFSCRGGFASGRPCGLPAYVLESDDCGVGVWVDRVSATIRIAIGYFEVATVEGSLSVVERKPVRMAGFPTLVPWSGLAARWPPGNSPLGGSVQKLSIKLCS